MPISSTKRVFTQTNVDNAPDSSGVYGLYDAKGATIYYGSSKVSIRTRLQSHVSGNEGACTKNAFYFNTELTTSAAALPREGQLLREHEQQTGSLPRCNNVHVN